MKSKLPRTFLLLLIGFLMIMALIKNTHNEELLASIDKDFSNITIDHAELLETTGEVVLEKIAFDSNKVDLKGEFLAEGTITIRVILKNNGDNKTFIPKVLTENPSKVITSEVIKPFRKGTADITFKGEKGHFEKTIKLDK